MVRMGVNRAYVVRWTCVLNRSFDKCYLYANKPKAYKHTQVFCTPAAFYFFILQYPNTFINDDSFVSSRCTVHFKSISSHFSCIFRNADK